MFVIMAVRAAACNEEILLPLFFLRHATFSCSSGERKIHRLFYKYSWYKTPAMERYMPGTHHRQRVCHLQFMIDGSGRRLTWTPARSSSFRIR